MSAAGPITPLTVVVTGRGAVSALGDGYAALCRGLAEGRDGFVPVRRLDLSGFTTRIAAMVADWNHPELASLGAPEAGLDLWLRLALPALVEAWQDAGLATVAADRIALVVGTLRGHQRGRHVLAEVIAAAAAGIGCHIDGPRLNVATACASSTHGLGLAHDLLASGACDVVLAGGSDAITIDMFAGFHALGLLSRQGCAPFSEPPGTSLGEGAGFLVLERAGGDGAPRPGAIVRAGFPGYGFAADAYHPTTPEPGGAGVARAIGSALAHAGLAPAAIGYVNAHATGTENNDRAEWRGIERALGEVAQRTPVSASKSAIGHAQGAAGILEAIITVEALAAQQVPPTLHFTAPRPGAPPDPVGEGIARPHSFAAALSVSAAFGGANSVVALTRTARPTRLAPPRPLTIAGAGVLSPLGDDLDALADAVAAGRAIGRRVAPYDLARYAPRADPRGIDASGRLLTAAAARALADAGLVIRGERRERSGLFVGADRLSPSAVRDYLGSLERRGALRPSTSHFSHMVLNAAAGAASAALDLRGPLTVVAANAASGLVALCHAAAHLDGHPEVDRLVVGSVDEAERAELSPVDNPDEEETCEGAACLVLATDGGAADAGGGIRLAGRALGGAGAASRLIAETLALAGCAEGDVDLAIIGRAEQLTNQLAPPAAWPLLDPAPTLGAGGARSALALVAAVSLLRRERARTVLILEATRDVTAVVLLARA